ncbi:unnamed protein product, partial [Iphiclides podalirius]
MPPSMPLTKRFSYGDMCLFAAAIWVGMPQQDGQIQALQILRSAVPSEASAATEATLGLQVAAVRDFISSVFALRECEDVARVPWPSRTARTAGEWAVAPPPSNGGEEPHLKLADTRGFVCVV